MITENGLMGILGFERHWLFFPNSWSNPSSVRGFSISYKPISCIVLNKKSANRIQVSGIRAPAVGVVALQSGERETSSATKEFIEREFKFNPVFNDYVKIMESVQTDRSKHSSLNVDGSSPKRRLSRKDVSGETTSKGNGKPGRQKGSSRIMEDVGHEKREGSKENDLGRDKFGYIGREKDVRVRVNTREVEDVETSRSGWGLVEALLVKGGENSGGQNRGKPSLQGSNRGLRNERGNSLNGVRDTTYDENLEKREVVLGNNSRRQKDQSQNGKHTRNMGKVGFNNATKEYGSNKSLCERSCSVGRNIGRKLSKSEISKPGFKRDRVYRTNMGNKMGESKVHKSLLSRMDRMETESNFRNSKAGVLEMRSDFKEQNIHANSTERNIGHHGASAPKRNWSNSSKEIQKQSRSQGDFKFQGNDYGTKKVGSKSFEICGRLGENDMQANKVTRRDLDGIDLEDRAAFKTFEVFTDVRNRPRVLRMEMEERIHKLAKWLNATDINLPEWQFSRMMHGAKIKFTDHSILRTVQILGSFGNWKRVLQVVEWLQSRERFKSYKSRYIYTTVLNVLGKAKRPVEALNIFYAMRQELSSYPDLAAYHCIAVTLGQAGLMKELFDVIDCMRATPKKKFKLGPLQKWDPRLEPDLVVYNAVLNACVQQKQWEGAFWVLQQLKQQGIRPSSTTYGLVMEVMLACNKYNLVHEFFRKVEMTSIPSPLNYKVLVNTLWREGKTDEAVSAIKDMERRGIVGSASLYYDLARCLCSAGRCKEALLQIDKICKVAKKPLVVTYTGLIQACLESGSIQNGAYIFNQMHKFCSPNVVTCNIMLKSYLEHGMFDEAKDLFQKILDGSHDISEKSDLKGKVVPDKFTFNTMMEACVATKNWDFFENAYRQMLQHGYHFDTKRHLRIVMDASRAGKVQLLDTTWEHLVRAGRVPPPPIIKERFCMKLQEDEFVAAISCLGIHERTELNAFSEDSWIYLFKVNAHRFKKDTIVRLGQEVNTVIGESSKPHPILQNLLNACRKLVTPVAVVTANLLDNHRMISSDIQVSH